MFERGLYMGIEKKVEPLMYIDQPLMKKPVAMMQAHYESDGSQKELENGPAQYTYEDNDFKHLSIREKIHYLIHLPHEIPRIKCEIKTEEMTYHGTVEEENGGVVVVKVYGKGYENIKIKQIKNIKMIGF